MEPITSLLLIVATAIVLLFGLYGTLLGYSYVTGGFRSARSSRATERTTDNDTRPATSHQRWQRDE